MNYIDIILFLFIFLITFLSAHKGLFHVLSQFAATVASLILAKVLSAPVSSFLYTQFLENSVRDKLTELLPEGSVSGELQSIADSALESLPSFIQKLAAQLHLVDLLHAGAGSELLSVEQIQTDYVAPLVIKAISAVCFLVLFALLALLLKGVALWLNHTFFDKKDGALSRFNKFTGAIFGVLRGSIAVLLIALLLNLIASFVQAPVFQNLVTNSYICNYISTLL